MTCAEDVGVDDEQREAPSSRRLPSARPPRGAPQHSAPSLGSPQSGRPWLGEAIEQTVEWSLPQPLRTRRWWKAVEKLGRGWGRATERGCGGERRQRRRTHRGEAPAPPTGGSPAPGEPAASSILVDGGGERRLGLSIVAPVPQGPPRRRRWNQGLSPRPNGGAQLGLRGAKFPSPTGFGFELVPSSHSSPDKMEDVVSSCSHDGRWGDNSPRG